ncbi:hypothetical protein IWZ01DRAFT_478214 [Phyllosticta capitalensis]
MGNASKKNSSRPMSPRANSQQAMLIKPSIPHLPNEVLDNILSFCDPWKTLISARLVSRAFCEMASRYFFATVTVDLIADKGVAPLEYLVSNEKYAGFVKELWMSSRWTSIKVIKDVESLEFLPRRQMEHYDIPRLRRSLSNFKNVWDTFLKSVKKLPNLEEVYWENDTSDDDFDIAAEDDLLTLTLIALAEPLHGSGSFRTLETFGW